MKKLSQITSILIMLFIVFSCDNQLDEVQPEIEDELSRSHYKFKASKVTGFVQIAWKGKGGKASDGEKLVFASFSGHESTWRSSKKKYFPPKGFFFFSVLKSDFTLERRIIASVVDVGFSEGDEKKAWLYAKVISDTKCDASDHSNCSGSDHTDGGCSHDDSSHDSGCSHDTGTDHTDTESGGGCEHDDTDIEHDEGGCDHDDGDSESGCDHDDTTHDTDKGGKPDDKGGKGKQCRVGQYVVAKMHDKGSPGINDGITWKWVTNLDGFAIEEEPKHLCKKEILSGNLKVHIWKQKENTH